MKLQSLMGTLMEKISNDLYIAADEAIREAVRAWTYEDGIPEVKSRPEWIKLQEEIDTFEGDYSERASQAQYDLRSKQRDFVEKYLLVNDQPNWGMLAGFKHKIELALQKCARDYVERTLGKIEDWDYDDATFWNKHLYWLKHIVVEIVLNAKNKEGRVLTGGGEYYHRPGKNTLQSFYAMNSIDKHKDLWVGIRLFMVSSRLWLVANRSIIREVEESLFGESDTRTFIEYLEHIIPTFVHEVGHLEQASRNDIADQQRPASRRRQNQMIDGGGLTHTPAPGKKVQKIKKNGKQTGSARGRAFRDVFNNVTPDEFRDYLGTTHEIEAHAMGAAADIMREIVSSLRDRYSHRYMSKDERTRLLNREVDQTVVELQHGGWPMDQGSLKTYRDWIWTQLPPEQDARDFRFQPRDKVNHTYRKVWTIFLKKLMNHLLAYKKPVPLVDPTDSYERETNPQPRTARVGDIAHPPKKPRLP